MLKMVILSVWFVERALRIQKMRGFPLKTSHVPAGTAVACHEEKVQEVIFRADLKNLTLTVKILMYKFYRISWESGIFCPKHVAKKTLWELKA